MQIDKASGAIWLSDPEANNLRALGTLKIPCVISGVWQPVSVKASQDGESELSIKSRALTLSRKDVDDLYAERHVVRKVKDGKSNRDYHLWIDDETAATGRVME